MRFLQSTWETIVSAFQFFLEAIFGRRKDWQEKLDEFNYLENIEDSLEVDDYEKFDESTVINSVQYQFEKPDIELTKKCAKYIHDKFPNGFAAYYHNSTLDERIDLVRTMTYELAEVYGVNISDVVFFTPNIEREIRTAGQFSPNDNSVQLNFSLLVSPNRASFTDMMLTVLHELKHARQWAAKSGWYDYGYSPELLFSWSANWINGNYIDFMVDDEGYRKQPLEADAFAFMEQFRNYFTLFY